MSLHASTYLLVTQMLNARTYQYDLTREFTPEYALHPEIMECSFFLFHRCEICDSEQAVNFWRIEIYCCVNTEKR
jgi:hypothetical protein